MEASSDQATSQALRQQLEDNMIRSTSGRSFLPDSSLPKIFTRSVVTKVVQELKCLPEEHIRLIDTIMEEGLKTFAILVWMHRANGIVLFRTHEALDNRLPLSEDLAKNIAPDFGAWFAREEQWRFLPYRFPPKGHERHVEIGEERILPFIGKSVDLDEGSFGRVFTMNIWPSQQAFFPEDSEEVQIIIKRLKPKIGDKVYRQERTCLTLMNQLKHPNVIPFLGSYTYRGDRNFLFPRLDMDLKKFLTLPDRFGSFQHDFTFYSALRGLCSALLNIHELHLNQDRHGVDFDSIGYHHDIRPANILVNQETFILADFGLGNVKDSGVRSQTAWTQTLGDYLAPECMEGLQSQTVGRSIDIWAIGCLIADIVTYIHLGNKGVQEFSKERLTPGVSGWIESLFHSVDGHIKTEVVKWLHRLPQVGPGGISISPLVELSLYILTKDAVHRPKISNVCQRLTLLSLQAHFSACDSKLRAFCENHPSADVKLIQHRLVAWGHVLELDQTDHEKSSGMSDCRNNIYDEAINLMTDLFFGLSEMNETAVKSRREGAFDEYVGWLWDLLPSDIARRANEYWQYIVLSTDDTSCLHDLERALSSTRFSAFYATRALAMMRMIRLAVLSPEALDAESYQLNSTAETQTLTQADVMISEGQSNSYSVGKLECDGSPVLVEWMWYAMSWYKVAPEQRSLLMSLKAQSFGMPQKPDDLRTLDCVGIFEQNDDKFGYGFVYRIPPDMEPEPLSLFRLLDQDPRQPRPQPFLGDKFKMAASIGEFLKQFHTVGWLHENFNSRNIIFFAREPRELPLPDELRKPYFVGLYKSRPDGSLWQTDGPDGGAESDYQHPDYASSGRYRIDFDYYSLGIILLEIGLWRSLSAMLSTSSRYSKMSAKELREDHIRRCRARLGPKMGKVYAEVALKCLDGTLQQSKDELKRSTQDQGELAAKTAALGRFIEDVVEPLQTLALVSI
ncbi:hypothetical protein N0V82_000621 [Gnomoniopsis sp. IMI 355080]|nr:hypothetical protein N0V82_000621 [Gnomoniopsis sp. IMI 355080]